MSSVPVVEDDEGIIDLNALATCVPRGRTVAPLFPASEPPPGAFARDAMSSPQLTPGRNHRLLFVVGGAIVALAGVIGIAFMFRGEEPAPITATTAVVTTPTTVPTAPAAAVPAPVETTTAAPPSTATATNESATSDDDDPPAKQAKKHGGKGKKGTKKAKAPKSKSGAPKAAAPKTPKTPKKKAASDPCNCHNDLNCVLACTVKRGH